MFLGLILYQILASTYAQEEPSESITTVFVKQSGKDENSGLEIGKEKPSLNDAYNLLSNGSECNMKIVNDVKPLIAEAVEFNLKRKITIEGVNSDGKGNTEVAIDCYVHPGSYLFKCEGTVEFKYLAFHFPTTLRNESQENRSYDLISGSGAKLSISNCRFIRPESEGCHTDIYLVYSSGGSLTLESVECADDTNALTSKNALFRTMGTQAVILSNLTLKNIDTSDSSVVVVASDSFEKSKLILNGSSFSELKCDHSVLFVGVNQARSTFSVGDGGVTTFSSCSCSNNKGSGGIYLQITAIESANQIKWPEDGTNLIFDRCTAGEGESKRNIGLHLEMANDSLFEDIADTMKKSFATSYNRRDNLWNIVGTDNNMINECDFVFKFFDPLPPRPENMTKAFVKNGGKGNGISVELAAYSLKDAYNFLEKSAKCIIETVKTEDPLPAEAITFNVDNGIIIEGVNGDGNGNVEVAIDCDVRGSYDLFTCEKEVEFKYLAFNFPISEKKWDSLIFGNELSTLLSISNCRFVRVSSQLSSIEITANAGKDNSMAGSLVSVSRGKVEMNTVSCTDEKSTVSFSSSPFSLSSVSSASLNGVEVSNMKVQNGAAIVIKDGESTSSTVSIEGLSMKEVNSEKGEAAGLEISLVSEESTVAIGRTSKCTFKSCHVPKGKSGAIFIFTLNATKNLQLPSANNLEIDGSNTAGSQSSSLFIIAPDFDEFCKQEDAFEFANDYDISTAGWIVGAEDTESEPVDVYEKYLKKPDPAPEGPASEDPAPEGKKKPNAGTVVAIVVPIVVVVVAVVVVVVIFVIVKKRKEKSNKDEDNEGSKEQEMSTQE
ncbi:uncharacterized protein MONOS_11990 [Monocercomonoides exilis]|uniref:uncharacterized protein n=1 Tax=Monocercomonoides exilis TaxID=2049356 RepID=UPI003559EF4D|nr:hypothetical protein MONOS_11990 [Monocercomonoides exilis]|eukprot:MONOS_11990.1-p1 / transcript=MONOS_11990.1 / gene=MONOS_11990 / organism=Monocercomonoides_exilis_PA203 / gene_product=unspecified product / transcript_product=unspecified product / location=Mono_scaffold00633:28682-31180(-) / protein_length=833 / sequence_SO=supercontig / SO=protein_coding / is_pseudo=false